MHAQADRQVEGLAVLERVSETGSDSLTSHRQPMYGKVTGAITVFFAQRVTQEPRDSGELDIVAHGIEVPNLYPRGADPDRVGPWSGVARFMHVEELPVIARCIPAEDLLHTRTTGRFPEIAHSLAQANARGQDRDPESIWPAVQLGIAPIDSTRLGIVSSVVRIGAGPVGDAIAFKGDVDLEPTTQSEYQERT